MTTPAFLQLPIDIRQEIYALAGLVRTCPIIIEDERNRWSTLRADCKKNFRTSDSARIPVQEIPRRHVLVWHRGRCAYQTKADLLSFPQPGIGCIHPPLPMHILLISRQIYLEASHVLWSRNNILLGPALGIPPRALCSLTCLEIRLTSCSCVTNHRCEGLHGYKDFHQCRWCHLRCKRGDGEPLSLSRPPHQTLVNRWGVFCESLRSSSSKDLELTLICDCEDLVTANTVIQALDGLTGLKNATIRLSQSCNQEFQELAKHTVKSMIRKRQPETFPFSRLPIELQELVLTYTDLVAPDDISWNEPIHEISSIPRGMTPGQKAFEAAHRPSAKPHLLYDEEPRCCLQCTSSREVCACPTRHGSYTSRLCKCWDFPKALFLVSKPIHQLAVKIFFSCNKITLWDTSQAGIPGHRRAGAEFTYLVEANQILREMPRQWLSNLRWLRIAFRDFHSSDVLLGTACYESWERLTTKIKTWPWLAMLTMEIDLANQAWLTTHHRVISRDDSWTSFRNIAALFALKQPQTYKDFFFRLAYQVGPREEEDDWARWRLERELEQEIMGCDYDATERGKYRGRKWFHDESLRPKTWWAMEHDIVSTDRRLYTP